VRRLKIFVKIRESLCESGPGSERRLEVTTTSPEGGGGQVDIVVGDVGAHFGGLPAQFTGVAHFREIECGCLNLEMQ
jgi:hypothetical protein